MASTTLVAIADATLDANNPTTNQGTGNTSVGEYSGGSQINRVLMKFDLSSLSGKTTIDLDILIKTLAGHNIKGSNITARYTSINQEDLKTIVLKFNYMNQFETL